MKKLFKYFPIAIAVIVAILEIYYGVKGDEEEKTEKKSKYTEESSDSSTTSDNEVESEDEELSYNKDYDYGHVRMMVVNKGGDTIYSITISYEEKDGLKAAAAYSIYSVMTDTIREVYSDINILPIMSCGDIHLTPIFAYYDREKYLNDITWVIDTQKNADKEELEKIRSDLVGYVTDFIFQEKFIEVVYGGKADEEVRASIRKKVNDIVEEEKKQQIENKTSSSSEEIPEESDENIVIESEENVIETHTPTRGESNALKTAKRYISVIAFSYTGLVKQLEYEKFTHEEAVYGADNCGADWKEQASKKAKEYIEVLSLSKEGLINQLEYEGFTHDEAVYGVEQNWD